MIRTISTWVAVLLLLVCNTAWSLGLGDIKLKSKLNQPLNAEITLLSADSLSKSQLLITLASEDAFRRAGVEYIFFLNKIRFVPDFKDDGSVIIKLTTRDPIKEPFLDFLIEVNWPNGRIMREYTLLLDPPSFSEVEMSSAPEAAVSSSNNNFQPQQVDTDTIAEDNYAENDYSDDRAIEAQGEYRVKTADTLWAIARKNRVSNTSIQQTMVSIFNDNPNAFINDNMNQLKSGSVLKLEELNSQAITQQQALLEIARQNQLWGGRGNAGTRPDAVLDTADYASTSYSSDNSEPRLKLAAVSDGDASASSAALESEAVSTLSDENKSLRSRLDDLAEQNEKLQRLVELKNSELAAIGHTETASVTSNEQLTSEELNSTLIDNNQTDDVEVSTLNTESTDTSLDASKPIAESQTDAEVIDSTEDSIATTSETTAPIKEATVNMAPAVAVKEESLIDSILNLGEMVWMAIISGVLILFFSFLWIRRQNMSEEDFQDSLVIPLTSDFDEDDFPDVGDDILATEMGTNPNYIPESDLDSLDEDPVDIETNADPLGEADVYLAYGKFDQAERILREALDEDPNRLDLRLKIMECFAETKSLSEFTDQKREILEILATDDSVAEQVKIMERQAWPEEIDKDDEIPSTEDIFGDLSFGKDADSSDELTFPTENQQPEDVISTDDAGKLDSVLDFTAANSDDSELSENFNSDEFIDEEIDLESDDKESDFVTSSEESDDESNQDGADLISESELMDSEIDDDILEELDDEPVDEAILDLGDVDEASTKLDLARAYIDMEDYDGATEILQEVISEGSDTQKGEAEELLERMK